jgi:NTP pyrophosphatase (non-canonical NTP hydrolase)
MKISEAQDLVKEFAKRNKWKDWPNIDKFDHIHEELIEMSQHLRYKAARERKKAIKDKRAVFEDGIGDVLFSTLRLANQLDVDAEKAFGVASKRIAEKYQQKGKEHNIPWRSL